MRTVRGGTGSGDPLNGGLSGGGDIHVNQSPRYHINIMSSFLEAGYRVVTEDLLNEYAARYDAAEEKAAGNPMETFAYPEMRYSPGQISGFAGIADTAVYVLSRNSGEGADRCLKKNVTIDGREYEIGDYEFSRAELENLDVLTGKVTPSGKLTSTWAKAYSDYPASATFAYNDNDVSKEKYEEGIYVGYRYFIPSALLRATSLATAFPTPIFPWHAAAPKSKENGSKFR